MVKAHSSPSRSGRMGRSICHNHYAILCFILVIGLLFTAVWQFWPHNIDSDTDDSRSIRSSREMVIQSQDPKSLTTDESCLFHTCFDVYHCGYNDDNRITVYVYPTKKFVDDKGVPINMPMSKEFGEILQTITDSVYYTSDPDKACLFIPPIDVLNQNNLRLNETSQVLQAMPRWLDGANHLLFNMLPGTMPDYNSTLDVQRGRSILAGGGFNSWTYRQNYDISIPVFNPTVSPLQLADKASSERQWLLVSAQLGLHPEYYQDLSIIAHQNEKNFLLLEPCESSASSWNMTQRCSSSIVYEYPQVLQDSTFCLVVRGGRLGQPSLTDVLMAGCIPVFVADTYILPFSEVLDWKRAALVVKEDELQYVMQMVKNVSEERIKSMQKQVKFYWESYFSSMRAITLATLQIINDRVFPYAAKRYEEWNDPYDKNTINNPLFLPVMPPKSHGFTAVILTYDRLEFLFRVIQQVAKAPSLAKILVVWNNQIKQPPPASVWPKISKPLKVVQTRQNKLSNRFYPFDEIETEAILALDDDIVMLTTDELEFGYEVWREFPDRLVGFPSRLHLWDNATQAWRYESEWSSEISMVLTGAAFYHKYYNYLYTNSLPKNMKAWVDEQMNCEDIAMNFLIANTTGKSPIKVTPRQKFKCTKPECQNYPMLSADLGHMVERSECITKFVEMYKSMPLQTIEFRADPVLYKDNFPYQLKSFNEVGNL